MRKKRTRRIRKWLSLFLTVAMFFTMQGMPVLAETAGQPAEARSASPANPVHTCTKQSGGSDCTEWSYVYFGSYPQTEVTGDALTATITGASYDSNGDAWVSGIKYRRISKNDTNNDDYFGSSEYRYFKWERIRWRVLENNGSTLFVAADKGLDCKDYNEVRESIIWENCTLRSWLNQDFYNTAFSESEQGAIAEQTVVNEDNPYYNTEGGNDTRDKVFLLSIGEVTNPDYGFCEDYNTYSASRWVQPSDYAHARGASTYSSSDTGKNANGWWWHRSPGSDTHYAAGVDYGGGVIRHGSSVNDPHGACVPALHINLASDLWSMTDNGTSGSGESGTGEEPAIGNQNSGVGSGIDVKPVEIIPKATSIKGKITAKKKAFLVKWKKQSGVSGYQIQYSTNGEFTRKTTKAKMVQGASKTKVTIKKLKARKKYYVRIRTFQKSNGTVYYSSWSKKKSVKIKK